MAKKNFSFRFEPDLIDRVDAASGDRTTFVTAAIELALGVAERPSLEMTVDQAMEPNELLRDLPMKPVSNDAKNPIPPQKNSNADALDKGSDQKSADERRLLDFLRCGVRTEREIAKEIGWHPMRVSKVVARLGAAGKVKFRAGAIEVCDV